MLGVPEYIALEIAKAVDPLRQRIADLEEQVGRLAAQAEAAPDIMSRLKRALRTPTR